jgi:MFS family permease
MRATAARLLSIFLIIGQIFGGSLAGGVVGTSISNPQAYRALYLIFASIALVATCITSLLAPRASARSRARLDARIWYAKPPSIRRRSAAWTICCTALFGEGDERLHCGWPGQDRA